MTPAVGRIQRRSTFRALAHPDGRGRQGPVSVVFSRAPGTAFPVAAYALGRRHGDAVRRNRLRRRLREAMRAAAPELGPGAYLLRAAPSASGTAFIDLCDAVRVAATAAGRAAGEAGNPR
jgi:ribonuclease P protein component